MIKRDVMVLCSNCKKSMDIEEWGLYEFWLLGVVPKQKNYRQIKNYPAPHKNRGHPCSCGKYWLSSDCLELVKDTSKEIVYSFYEGG